MHTGEHLNAEGRPSKNACRPGGMLDSSAQSAKRQEHPNWSVGANLVANKRTRNQIYTRPSPYPPASKQHLLQEPIP